MTCTWAERPVTFSTSAACIGPASPADFVASTATTATPIGQVANQLKSPEEPRGMVGLPRFLNAPTCPNLSRPAPTMCDGHHIKSAFLGQRQWPEECGFRPKPRFHDNGRDRREPRTYGL